MRTTVPVVAFCCCLALSASACSSSNSAGNSGAQTTSESESSQSKDSADSTSSSSKESGGTSVIADNTSKNGSSNSSADAATTIKAALGEPVTNENYEFSLTSAEWVDEIYPPDTSGYYRYYQDEEDKTYLLIKGTYKNLWSDFTEPNWATSASIKVNDKYNVDAQIEVVQNGSMSVSYAIDPLEESEIYLWASVSDEMKEAAESVKVVWNIPRDNFNGYYRASSAHDTYEITI